MRRWERISANNTSGYIRSLAWRSLKSSRLRNVFVILTIVLSVSLLMVMALFYAGLNTATKRQVEKMQHVIYYGLSEEQLSDMAAKDSPASYVLGMKQGQGVEIDGVMVSPVAYTGEPLKDGCGSGDGHARQRQDAGNGRGDPAAGRILYTGGDHAGAWRKSLFYMAGRYNGGVYGLRHLPCGG